MDVGLTRTKQISTISMLSYCFGLYSNVRSTDTILFHAHSVDDKFILHLRQYKLIKKMRCLVMISMENILIGNIFDAILKPLLMYKRNFNRSFHF